MGDYADMVLDGIYCQLCGSVVGEGEGFPVICFSCQKEHNCDGFGDPVKPPAKKVKCPQCGKKVKEAGLKMHQKDVHNIIEKDKNEPTM